MAKLCRFTPFASGVFPSSWIAYAGKSGESFLAALLHKKDLAATHEQNTVLRRQGMTANFSRFGLLFGQQKGSTAGII